MNTLTQQQINQYQWQVADGVARPVIPIPSNVLDENWVNKASELLPIIYHTNAPDGIYSGEAFELMWQIMDIDEENPRWDDVSEHAMKCYGFDYKNLISVYEYDDTVHTRLSLRLKPSHLPAVLTTQPGEEWKDRYKAWLISLTQKDAEMPVGYDYVIPYLNCGVWRVEYRLITPSAEQEAETVERIIDKLQLKYDENGAGCSSVIKLQRIEQHVDTALGIWRDKTNQLQSPLTQKDQRIAELEKMLDQCQKNDLYFEQEKEHLNNKIAELEREREWISVDEFDESTLPIVGKSVIGIVDYITSRKEARDYIVCYMDEEKQTRLLADDDYYGWDFDECIVKWTYLYMPLRPIF